MKYHINKKGEVSICLAVFRDCPYTQHFNSFYEGQEYMDNWEGNKETFPKLKDEDILKPENKFIIEGKNFKNKDLLKTVDLNDNSIILLMTKNQATGKILGYISDKVKNKQFSSRKMYKAFDSVGLSLDRSGNFGDSLNMEILLDKFKEEKYSISNILSSFDYSTSDVILDKNTKLRVFNLTPDPEYNYNPSGKIYPKIGGSEL